VATENGSLSLSGALNWSSSVGEKMALTPRQGTIEDGVLLDDDVEPVAGMISGFGRPSGVSSPFLGNPQGQPPTKSPHSPERPV